MKRILVVGDAMLDRYWFGDVSRISPEAPVPVVAVARTEERMGAAANVARNIAAMGADVTALYSKSFHEDPIIKLRILGRGHQIVRADFDTAQEPIDLETYEEGLEEAEIVVISDYGKGALANIVEVVKLARKAGKTILVDPKGYRYEKYAGAAVVKPNLDEMKILVGGWDSEDELEFKVNVMRNNAGIEAVLLTRGPGGMTLYNGHATSFPSVAREVRDVSGAGEAAISAFAVSIARGLDLDSAAMYANRAAGLACEHVGTTVVDGGAIWS